MPVAKYATIHPDDIVANISRHEFKHDRPKKRELVREWAPLVWLAPGEKFLPLDVPEFLDNVKAGNDHLHTRADVESLLRNRSSFIYGKEPAGKVPVYALVKECTVGETSPIKKKKKVLSLLGRMGKISEPKEIKTKPKIGKFKRTAEIYRGVHYLREGLILGGDNDEEIMRNRESGSKILGKETITRSDHISGNEVVPPSTMTKTTSDTIRDGISIPVTNNSFRKFHFHVTYWMFYPFSEGKAICVLDLGFFGSWPIPKVGSRCLGSFKEFGSHVGDWEHMSLYFQGAEYPSWMYVSAHDAGAFYRYEPSMGIFMYDRQETREGLFQKPIFPERVLTSTGKHPVLFSARGSHGLWTAPGKHKFVRLPRLYDESGFGIAWPTWKKIELLPTEDNDVLPAWMAFRGKWGNPRSNCHPLVKLGLNICEFVDGPTGIPTKMGRFRCQR